MIVSTNNVRVCYGRKVALDGFSFEMAKGEIAAILGPNGSGKTTLFRLLLGLLKQNAGAVEIFGGRPGSRHTLAKIGATIETPSLYGHLSALENLQVASHLKERKPDIKKLNELIGEVGLANAGKMPAKKYSMGMRQRLALAQALICEPELLILDEPANGLDPEGIRWFREWVVEAPAARGLSILLSSHILNEVALIAQKVVLLKEGRIRFAGALNELWVDLRHKIRIKTANIADSQAFLQSNGYKITIDDDALLVDGSPEQRPEIARMLVQEGHDLLECISLEPTLEDQYLSLMEGSHE